MVGLIGGVVGLISGVDSHDSGSPARSMRLVILCSGDSGVSEADTVVSPGRENSRNSSLVSLLLTGDSW